MASFLLIVARGLRPSLCFYYKSFIGPTSAFQHRFTGLYRNLSGFRPVIPSVWDPMPFPVPVILSVHIPLGPCYGPAGLHAPVTHHGLSCRRVLLDRSRPRSYVPAHFYAVRSQARTFAGSSVPVPGHSDHRYFIDPRPIGSTIHLWTAFGMRNASCGCSRPTSPGFTRPAFHHQTHGGAQGGVSGRYPFIPPFGLPVLQMVTNTVPISARPFQPGTGRTCNTVIL